MRCVSLFLVAAIFLHSIVAEARPLVAVIDSGVGATAELRPHLVGEIDAAARPARPALRPRFDHGTKVATVLSRAARGRADILSIRVDDPAGCAFGRNPPCQRDPAVIAWAIHAAVAHRADVINISMALMDAPAISDAVAFAAWSGTLVVIASGNDGRRVPGNLSHARAGYPNAVLVGALERDGTVWARSNRPAGSSTPGYNFAWRWGAGVPSAAADGTPVVASGTSIAAPVEAGFRVRRRAAAGPAVFLVPVRRKLADRPVMLAGTAYPDPRSRACASPVRPSVRAHCLGSTLLA